MSSVYTIAISGLTSAQQQLLSAAKTISFGFAGDTTTSGYGAGPRDSVSISGSGATGGSGAAAPASYSPPVGQGQTGAPPADGDLTSAIVQTLVAKYAFTANAKVIAAQRSLDRSLLDVLA